MIYGTMADGSLFIGLSEENLRLLREGRPICKEDVSGHKALIIVYGETEWAIIDAMCKVGMLDGALVHDDPAGAH